MANDFEIKNIAASLTNIERHLRSIAAALEKIAKTMP